MERNLQVSLSPLYKKYLPGRTRYQDNIRYFGLHQAIAHCHNVLQKCTYNPQWQWQNENLGMLVARLYSEVRTNA